MIVHNRCGKFGPGPDTARMSGIPSNYPRPGLHGKWAIRRFCGRDCPKALITKRPY